MPQRAKLFKSRGCQAVRLPREFQLDKEEEVLIYRQGNRIVLEPLIRRAWSPEFLALAGSAQDFAYPGEPPAADSGPDLK
jgi:virulence-associated protein VagC